MNDFNKQLDEALSRIMNATNRVINQTVNPICKEMPVTAKEMMRLAMSKKLCLGHYLTTGAED